MNQVGGRKTLSVEPLILASSAILRIPVPRRLPPGHALAVRDSPAPGSEPGLLSVADACMNRATGKTSRSNTLLDEVQF